MKRLVTILGVTAILCGCGDKSVTPPKDEPQSKLMYLDETIVQKISDWIPGVAVGEGDIEFDLSQDPLYRDSSANDFEIRYTTGTSADVPNWLWRPEAEDWVQFSPQDAPGYVVHPMFSCKYNSLSGTRIALPNVISPVGTIRFRSSSPYLADFAYLECRLALRTYQLHSKYFAVVLQLEDGSRAYDIAFDGQYLWTFGHYPPSLYKFTTSGELVNRYDISIENSSDICFDGTNLWLIAGYSLARFNTGGEILNQVTLPTRTLFSVTAGADRLWFLKYEPDSWLAVSYTIDSLLSGEPLGIPLAFSLDRFNEITDLAYHSGHLVIATTGSLVAVDADGETVRDYPLPVKMVSSVDFDDSTVWILHHGPVGSSYYTRIATQFAIR